MSVLTLRLGRTYVSSPYQGRDHAFRINEKGFNL